MPGRRRVAVLACALTLLATIPPGAALHVTLDRVDGYDAWLRGAITTNSPSNLALKPENNGYALSWQAPADPTGLQSYTVYRLPGPGTPGEVVTWTSQQAHTKDQSAQPGMTYVYLVTATFGAGESITSNAVTTQDLGSPRCGVVSVYTSPPYIDVHVSCLFGG